MIDTGLKGRVVLVTGTNTALALHGIGAATATAFAAEGAVVLVHYLRIDDERPAEVPKPTEPGKDLYRLRRALTADAVVAAIRDAGGRAEAWEADLSDVATMSKLFERAEAAFGPVDVLVNNAAHWQADSSIPQGGEPENRFVELWTDRPRQITAESHDRHFAVNTRAVALAMAEFVRRHVARGATWGRIVSISTDGAPGFSGEVSYGASKYALESYSRAAAKELGQYGITVNVVSPGPIQPATSLRSSSGRYCRTYRWHASVNRRTSRTLSSSWRPSRGAG